MLCRAGTRSCNSGPGKTSASLLVSGVSALDSEEAEGPQLSDLCPITVPGHCACRRATWTGEAAF